MKPAALHALADAAGTLARRARSPECSPMRSFRSSWSGRSLEVAAWRAASL